MIYIGIDNGVKSGALVALGQCGSFIEAITMPHNKHRSRNEVNIRAVHLWISNVTNGNLSNAEYVNIIKSASVSPSLKTS